MGQFYQQFGKNNFIINEPSDDPVQGSVYYNTNSDQIYIWDMGRYIPLVTDKKPVAVALPFCRQCYIETVKYAPTSWVDVEEEFCVWCGCSAQQIIYRDVERDQTRYPPKGAFPDDDV